MLRRSCSVQGSKQLFSTSERRQEKLRSPIFWDVALYHWETGA